MRIVLVRPNYDTPTVAPYLGLAYLSSVLKQNGIEVIVIDNLLYKLKLKDLIEKIKSYNPDCVGISCLSAFYDEVKELSLELKNNNIKVIIGGVHPTFMPYTTLKETKCDYVIAGEGEKVFPELLLNNIANNNPNNKIKGVYTINDITSDKGVETADYIENLDEIPFPDWDAFNPNNYPTVPLGGNCKKSPIGIIMTSRGCYGHCAFCASPFFYKNKVRFRSPENVVEEIELLINKYGVKEIHFLDDNPIVNYDYAYKLYNLMIERKIKAPWHCVNGIRADSLNMDLAKLMKKAGCYQVAIGIESANNQILKNIGKNETIEQINESINILKKAKITARGNFIFGLPGETKETIKETINFAVKSKLDKAAFYVLDVVPGSPLYRSGKYVSDLSKAKESYIKPNWLPKDLSEKDIEDALVTAYKKFYMRPVKIFQMIKDTKISQYKYIFHRLCNIGLFKIHKK